MTDILSTPKLGFGCMRLPLTNPEDQTSIDIEHFSQMVDAFIEAGCTYFDTAHVYHDGTSETALKQALTSRYPRDSYTVATKCLAWTCPDKQTAHGQLDISLERLGLDYVDYYLLHNVGGKRTAIFDDYDMWNFVLKNKEAGKIKHVGFSIHDGPEALDQLLTDHPEMEFVQIQVNYLDWDDPMTQSRTMMDIAAAHNKPVVIMEPARGGNLVRLPARAADLLRAARPDASLASWAYRFCYNLPGVITVLSGVSTLEQMQQNLADFAINEPFSPEEHKAIAAALAELRAVPQIPCTNCRYCMKDCPQHIQIPTTLALLNLDAMMENRDFVKGLYSWQTSEGRPSACIGCGACEDICPQGIDIIDRLAQAVELYE